MAIIADYGSVAKFKKPLWALQNLALPSTYKREVLRDSVRIN